MRSAARDCPDDRSACSEFDCIGFEPFGPTYYAYECNSTAEDFTCAAVADLDGDGRSGVFVVGTNNSGGATTVAPLPGIATAAGCNRPASAGMVEDCLPGQY